MVRAALPQFFFGNLQTNSNFPPEGVIITAGIPIPADWFDVDWNCRIPITINSGQVPTTQTDFPMLFNSTVADFIADAQSLGQDFRFVLPDKTILKHEIQSYDNGTGALIAWTKVPSISNGTLVYLYFNNPTIPAPPVTDAQQVWDSDYAGVWHMNDSSFATTITDSTDNNNDGNAQGGGGGLTQVNGKIGKAVDFDGDANNDSHYRVPMGAAGTNNKLNIFAGKTNEITVEGWLNFTVANQNSNFWVSHPNNTTAWDGAGNLGQYFSRQQNPKMEFFGHGNTSETTRFLATNSNIVASVFKHFAFTYVSSTQLCTWYIDAVVDNSSVLTMPWENTTGDVDLFISRNQAVGISGTSVMGFNGIIDELRISQIARTSDWITTEFNNQDNLSTFYTLGDVFCLGPVQDLLMIYKNDIQMIYKSGIKMQYQ